MKVATKELKLYKNNPRTISDYAFKKLVKSIKEFPEMLEARPIVVNKEMFILGGNMRFKACLEAGITEVPVIITDFTEAQQSEFVIKDNVSGGDWDWDILANEWNTVKLGEWGLDLPIYSDYDEEPGSKEAEEQITKGKSYKVWITITEDNLDKAQGLLELIDKLKEKNIIQAILK
jgi:hypothetical protein